MGLCCKDWSLRGGGAMFKTIIVSCEVNIRVFVHIRHQKLALPVRKFELSIEPVGCDKRHFLLAYFCDLIVMPTRTFSWLSPFVPIAYFFV